MLSTPGEFSLDAFNPDFKEKLKVNPDLKDNLQPSLHAGNARLLLAGFAQVTNTTWMHVWETEQKEAIIWKQKF